MLLPIGFNISASAHTELPVSNIPVATGNQMLSKIIASESMTVLSKSTEATRTFIAKEIPYVEQVKRMIF